MYIINIFDVLCMSVYARALLYINMRLVGNEKLKYIYVSVYMCSSKIMFVFVFFLRYFFFASLTIASIFCCTLRNFSAVYYQGNADYSTSAFILFFFYQEIKYPKSSVYRRSRSKKKCVLQSTL